MGKEDLRKKLKTKKKANNSTSNDHSPTQTYENKLKVKGQKKKKTSLEERKRSNCESDHVDQTNVSGMAVKGKKKIKMLRNKRKNDDINKMEFVEEQLNEKMEDEINEGEERKTRKLKKKRRQDENKDELGNIEKLGKNIEDKINEVEEQKKMKSKKKKPRNEKRAELDNTDNEKLEDSGLEPENQFEGSEASRKAVIRTKIKNKQVKKARKSKTVEESKDEQLVEMRRDAEDEVPEMSSGDEDDSKGMRRWVMKYKESRPDLLILQERIDDFITAHEAQEEQARKDREAQAAEGGWTVVVHHKGRKKTTDPESGIAVGSVAPAAVLDKMAKKKNKEVGLDFYRFQKREAHRNEIMMLQSKFEQDKKRIQQLRAQRKFKPY